MGVTGGERADTPVLAAEAPRPPADDAEADGADDGAVGGKRVVGKRRRMDCGRWMLA
jgi:hypothetical protein